MADKQLICYGRLTNLLTDALVESYVAAQQIQVSRDFAPIWGIDAQCVFTPAGGVVPVGAWQLRFMDHSTEVGDLGFHDDQGNPIAYVFVADDIADGCNWCVTASHETLEMLGDPLCTKTTINGGKEFCWEVCDACEDDRFAYTVEGNDGRTHMLSDFVTPAWFDASAAPPYSFRHNATTAFALAAGGYIGWRVPPDGAWEQQFAQGLPGRRAINKKPTSRTVRRFSAA